MRVPKKPTVREDAQITRDLLLLVDVTVPVKSILSWSKQVRWDVGEWAVDAHLCASDNIVRVRKMPRILLPFVKAAA